MAMVSKYDFVNVGDVFEITTSDGVKMHWACTKIDNSGSFDNKCLCYGRCTPSAGFTGLGFVVTTDNNKCISFDKSCTNNYRIESLQRIKNDGRLKRVCTLSAAEYLDFMKFIGESVTL